LQWFRLFGGGMGLPTRAGPLFPKADNRPSKKFGKHMSTVKYKIVTNHLSIGWFEKDEQSMYSVNGTGETLGFKASVSSFKFDLHQRRIVSKYDSEKFGRERIKPHWVLNEALSIRTSFTVMNQILEGPLLHHPLSSMKHLLSIPTQVRHI
jgi:hypothetical protein